MENVVSTYDRCAKIIGVQEEKEVGLVRGDEDAPCDRNKSIYIHRECLVRSLEGRDVDLLTVTSPAHREGSLPQEREDSLRGVREDFFFVSTTQPN